MSQLRAAPSIPGLGRPISAVALGTAFFRLAEQEACHALLDAFVEMGGTLIDSAHMYGDSEAVVGSWLRARGARNRVTVLTKGAHGDGVIPSEGYPEVIREELGTSLHLLGTDCIDLYMLHRDNQTMTVEQILTPLNEAVEAGQIRLFGASNWEYRRVVEANEYAARQGMQGFAVVSNTLSLATPAAAFYPGLVHVDPIGERWHETSGVPLIPWSSQARGFFTGAWTPAAVQGRKPGEMDAFGQRMLAVYASDENCARLERATRLGADRGGYTATEVALAWLLHKPFPVVPVVGPRTIPELESCVRAAELSLEADEVRWLERGEGAGG